MTKTKTQFIFCLLLVVFLLLPVSFVLARTVGITPPIVELPMILRGTSQEQSVMIVLKEPAQSDIRYQVSFRGDFAQNLAGESELAIPAGQVSAMYNFTVSSGDLATGDYEAYIDFLIDSSDSGEGQTGVGVTTGVTAIVKFSVVGEQILGYELQDLNIGDSEQNQPLYVSYGVNNWGNVKWRPDKIHLEIFDTVKNKKAEFDILADDIKFVNPGANTYVEMGLDHDLPVGKYTGQAQFYYQDNLTGRLTSNEFRIYEEGTLKQKGELFSLWTNKSEYKVKEKIKLEARFKNTGDVPLKGVLLMDIYDAQGDLVDSKQSGALIVDKAEETFFAQELELAEPGEYEFRAHVSYGSKKTDIKSITLNVVEGLSERMVWQWLLLLILTFVILFIVFIILKRRKEKEDCTCVDPGKIDFLKKNH